MISVMSNVPKQDKNDLCPCCLIAEMNCDVSYNELEWLFECKDKLGCNVTVLLAIVMG